MLRSYLTIALRNLKRHRFYALLNVIGLSIGVGCFLIAVIYASHEFSYNQHHLKLERIYRVVTEVTDLDGKHFNVNTRAVASHLEAEFPEIEHAVKMLNRQMWMSSGNVGFNGMTCIAGPNVLDTFTYPMVEGDPESIKRPGTAFITQSFARKLFGNRQAIGQTISVDYKWVKGDFEVTGILADIPATADFKLRFDFLSTTFPEFDEGHFIWEAWPLNWFVASLRTYLLLKPGTDVDALEQKIQTFAKSRQNQANTPRVDLHLQHAPRMHLYTTQDYGPQHEIGDHNGPSGRISRVRGVLIIGFLVLALACLNYINLVTSQSDVRSREVGLRKVSGASRKHLIAQFLGESILLTGVAFVIAIVLAQLALPFVNDILRVQLSLHGVDSIVLIGLPLILIPAVAILAGGYPALIISGHQPVEALSGKDTQRSRHRLRRALVTLQFSASMALIISTLVLHHQILYVQNKDLGFKRERVIIMPFFLRNPGLWSQQSAIRDEILRVPGVESASVCHHRPGEGTIDFRKVHKDGGSPDGYKVVWTGIDSHFLETFDVDLVYGRNIALDDRWTEPDGRWGINILINETGARAVGWTPETSELLQFGRNGLVRIVGVVEDYHNQSLHAGIIPMMLYPADRAKVVYARANADNLPSTLEALGNAWKRFHPDRPFEYEFLNDRFDTFYRAEMTQRKIFTFFSVLAIVVGCLGTLGLVTYSARRRRKEMGIRKSLGADSGTIVYLLSQEFLILVLAAFAIAAPVAYAFSSEWLNTFTYRIGVPISAFLVGGLLTLLLVAASIAIQTIRASREDPVDALRYE
jgi:putative ABC transport system permease protein